MFTRESALKVFCALFTLLFYALSARSELPPKPPSCGIVIDDLTQDSTLKAAGIQVGDTIYAWKSGETGLGGSISTAFDWYWLEIEHGSRGPLTLFGLRGQNEQKSFTAQPSPWRAKVHPSLPPILLDLYQQARAEADPINRMEAWNKLLALTRKHGDQETFTWINFQAASLWQDTSDWDHSIDTLLNALKESRTLSSRLIMLHSLAYSYERSSRYKEAESFLHQALEVSKAEWFGSLMVARSHTQLCSIAWKRSDLPAMDAHCKEALGIQEGVAPHSLEIATTLRLWGTLSWYRGDTMTARRLAKRSLEIREHLSPESLEVADSLNLLAVTYDNDEPDRAEQLHRKALAIREKVDPRGFYVASSLNNIGAIYRSRSDLETALTYYRQAQSIWERTAPDSADLADALSNIGIVLRLQGKLEESLDHYTRALEIQNRISPGSSKVANTLSSIGTVYVSKKDFKTASRFYNQALAIQERVVPMSTHVALILENLGATHIFGGDLNSATPYIEKALQIKQTLSPFGIDTAGAHNNMGNLLYRQGKLQTARLHFARCSEILQLLAPGSQGDSICLLALATIDRRLGRSDKAERYFKAALASFERQLGMMGGTRELKAVKRAGNKVAYVDYVDFLIEQGRPEEAFAISERYRAQIFLSLLTERDLLTDGNTPFALRERQRELRDQYQRAQSELIQAAQKQKAEPPPHLTLTVKKLWNEYSEATEALIKTAPRAAALRPPSSMDADAARKALDPGLCLVSYILADRTILFFATHDTAIKAVVLDVKKEELQRKIDVLRDLTASSRSTLNAARQGPTKALANELYTLLLAPIEENISQCTRMLIIPDGPLHRLPWGMLVRQSRDKERGLLSTQFLSEWMPYEIALSATTFAKLRSSRDTWRGSLSPSKLTAFGDPQFYVFPKEEPAGIFEPEIRSALQRGFDFSPIPASRSEVNRIKEIFNEHAQIYLGNDATEEKAKNISEETRIIHFATHALITEDLPLNSAVALTIPAELQDGRDNGLLQAWEILEQVRIAADLVVLSSCESGVGKDLGGEGLISLTRAFQYAGARSVLASLWKISDRTTAELMVRFYKHLKNGKAKDEALRAAQIELIRGPIEITNEKGEIEKVDASAPYYWAAFQLYGDWQ